jgi:hypothetical protein
MFFVHKLLPGLKVLERSGVRQFPFLQGILQIPRLLAASLVFAGKATSSTFGKFSSPDSLPPAGIGLPEAVCFPPAFGWLPLPGLASLACCLAAAAG